jgi:hypothetical protein
MASATERRVKLAFLFAVPGLNERTSSSRVDVGVREEERTQPKKAAVIVSDTTIETDRKSISPSSTSCMLSYEVARIRGLAKRFFDQSARFE